MSTPNRYAIREAGEATFYDIASGDAIVTLRTLKMTEVETTGETVYARGGRGNARLVGFSSDREARVTLQDAIFDNKTMAMLTGNEVLEGAKEIELIFEGVVPPGGTLSLPKTVEKLRTAYELHADGTTNMTKIQGLTATGKNVTFGVADEGKNVRVYYTAMSDATAKTVRVTSDAFGGTFKIVVDVMVRDEFTQVDYFAQFIANRAKVEDEFSFNFSPDGDPSVLDIPMEILRSGRNDMWELVIYDESAIV